jgi:replicative DNA helicase
VDEVVEKLISTDYYRPAHEVIHATIIHLYASGEPCNPVAVAHRLAETKQLGRVGGANYLHTLVASVPTTIQAGWYAGLVADASKARQVAEVGARLWQQAHDLSQGPAQLLGIAADLAVLARTGGRYSAGLPFVDGSSFTDLQDAVAALWGGPDTPVWASGESLMLFGPPGIGKSTLMHLLVFGRLGLFGELLGMPVQDDGSKLLYLAMDRPRQIARAMARLVRPQYRPVLAERLVVWGGPLPFDITKDRTRLAEICREQGVTTVVVDSIKDAVTSPSDEEAAGGYNQARQTCLAQGIEWLESHHNRKAQGENKQPNTIDDVYGNRWLTAGAGSVLCLWGTPGNPVVKLSQLKSPGEFLTTADVEIDFWQGEVAWAQQRMTDEALLRQKGEEGASVGEVLRVVECLEKPTPGDVERVRARLNARVRRGKLAAYDHPVDGLKRYYIPRPDGPPANPQDLPEPPQQQELQL